MLGGVVADWLTWRIGFFINVPIGIVLMLAGLRYIAETGRRHGTFDLAGALSSSAGMSALVYGIVRSASAGWSDPLTVAAVSAGIVLLAVFVLVESRVRQPIMPLRLFSSRERAAAYAARVLFLGEMVGFWFFTTQFLQGVLGFRPAEAGIAFLPTTLPNFAAAMAVPRPTRRLDNGRVLATGLALALIGIGWLSCVSVDSPYLAGVALPMVLIGIGQGLSLGPLTVAGVASVAAEDAGAASGVVNVAHQLGGSLGLGILVVICTAAGAGQLSFRESLAHQVAAALNGGTAMLAVALALVLALIARPGWHLKASH